MAMKGEMNVRIKIVISSHITEEENSYKYLEYSITITRNRDLEIKMNTFNQISCTERRTLNNKIRKNTHTKLYKTIVIHGSGI
jgi:hypothetical protein